MKNLLVIYVSPLKTLGNTLIYKNSCCAGMTEPTKKRHSAQAGIPGLQQLLSNLIN